MSNPPTHVLLGDIGATNARFALLADGELGRVRTFNVADFARFDDVVAAFLETRPVKSAPPTLSLLSPDRSKERIAFLRTAHG
jgi:glucokinase